MWMLLWKTLSSRSLAVVSRCPGCCKCLGIETACRKHSSVFLSLYVSAVQIIKINKSPYYKNKGEKKCFRLFIYLKYLSCEQNIVRHIKNYDDSWECLRWLCKLSPTGSVSIPNGCWFEPSWSAFCLLPSNWQSSGHGGHFGNKPAYEKSLCKYTSQTKLEISILKMGWFLLALRLNKHP